MEDRELIPGLRDGEGWAEGGCTYKRSAKPPLVQYWLMPIMVSELHGTNWLSEHAHVNMSEQLYCTSMRIPVILLRSSVRCCHWEKLGRGYSGTLVLFITISQFLIIWRRKAWFREERGAEPPDALTLVETVISFLEGSAQLTLIAMVLSTKEVEFVWSTRPEDIGRQVVWRAWEKCFLFDHEYWWGWDFQRTKETWEGLMETSHFSSLWKLRVLQCPGSPFYSAS